MKRLLSLLCLLPLAAQADPISSCTNIGGAAYQTTPPTYVITGTTYNVCSGCTYETIADVNGISTSTGDAILFKAGETFNIATQANTLDLRTGVLYGRYGSGVNPKITGVGLTMTPTFSAMIHGDTLSNVTWDGIDIDGPTTSTENFNLWYEDMTDSEISNMTMTGGEGAGIYVDGGSNITVDKVVLTQVDGGPLETIRFGGGTDTYVFSNSRSVVNSHAAINNVDNVTNGDIFGNEFTGANVDPTVYCERCQNLKIHDNWIHDTVDRHKPLISMGVENYGADANKRNFNVEVYDNVIENSGATAAKVWIKDDVVNTSTVIQEDIIFRNNAVINFGTVTWASGMFLEDTLNVDDGDWDNIVIRDNAFWNNNGYATINRNNSVPAAAVTIDYNLHPTGAPCCGADSKGSNAVTTSTVPFVDLANNDFDPAGPALGAGTGGGDIGAKITWTCGLGDDPNPDPDPNLTPLQTAKPDPYTISTPTHAPDHLWVFSDATGGTTIDDEGTGTACDLTLSGPASGSDSLGKYWDFNASESDIAQDATCADPPTTTGTTCAIFSSSDFPASNSTIASWGDVSGATELAAISLQAASGNAVAGLCDSAGCGYNNIGPWSVIDGNVNMVCVRQSSTGNDIWMNGSGWQTLSISSTLAWSNMDQFTVGALGQSTDSEYVDGKVYTVFSYDGTKTDAEMDTIWGDGVDVWDQIGVDQSGGGSPPSGNKGDYGNIAN